MISPSPIVITSNPMSASVNTEDMQHRVEEMINVVKSDLPYVKSKVSSVYNTLGTWRKHFNFGKSQPLSQRTMWKKYQRSNTVPIKGFT